MKICSRCKNGTELSNFHRDSKKKDGHSVWCKSCVYQCVKDSKHRRKSQMSKKAWSLKIKDSHLKTYYGICLEEYNRMTHDQDGRCAICHKGSLNLVVDHNHQTGQVRGLLCGQCNSAIGLFQDSPLILHEAANYLTVKGYFNVARQRQ